MHSDLSNHPVLVSVRRQLNAMADPEFKISGERFFKEAVVLYGVKATVQHQIAKDFLPEIRNMAKQEVVDLCENLWRSGYQEEAIIACDWIYAIRKKYTAEDLETFDHWIGSYVTNWATCDTLCNHPVGSFFEKYPETMKRLRTWAVSGNLWYRRAAAVSLIVPARDGKFLNEGMEICTILLKDREDLVQKGYGWLLKVLSEHHQKEVFEFIMSHRSVMPRTALRYAIEKMPAELKKLAMKK